MKMNVKGLVFVGFAAAVFAGAAQAAGENKTVTSLQYTEATYAKKTDLGAAASKGVDANFNDTTSTNLPTTAAVATYVGTVANTADSALQSVTANSDAGVVTNIAKSGTAVTMTKAKVTGSDIADNAGIAATQLASGVQTSLGYADAYHTASQTYGDIITHNAAEFETAGTAAGLVGTLPAGSDTVVEYVQTVAGTADSALQSVTANANAGVVTNIAADGTAVTMTKAKVTSADIADNAAIAATQLASGVQTTLTNAAADHTTIGGYGDIVTHNAAEFETAGTAAGLVGTLPAGSDTVVEYVQTVAGTADSALQSVTANANAGVVTNIATDGTAVTMTKAKVTGSDIADNAGIAATQLATGVQTSLGLADSAVQPGDIGTAAAANLATNGVAASEAGLVSGDQVNTAITNATSGKTVPATSTCTTFPCALVATAADTFSWEPIQQ